MKWENVFIGDIIKVSSGGTPSRKNPKYYEGGAIPWVKTGELKGKYVNQPKEYITKEALKNSSAKIFPQNTVLIAMYGATIGACSILPFEAATNQACAALLPDKNIDPIFLFYYLQTIKKELIKKGVGGAQPNISAGIIKNTPISLPPLETQKKIAEILDAADTLRQKTKTLIEKYDQLAQSLFLDMFGDPVVNNKKLPTIRLGKLGKWHSGGTPSRQKPHYFNGDIPWLSSGELNTMFSADSKEHISSFAINESSAKIIDPGSLLLGMYDTAALKSTINQVPLSCNQAIAYCKIDKEIANTIFIYCIIQIGREHYRRLQRGVRQKNLNLSMISNIEILFPPLSLQTQFAEKVRAIEEQKAKAQASLEKSEELFQSLLQRAFKGKLV